MINPALNECQSSRNVTSYGITDSYFAIALHYFLAWNVVESSICCDYVSPSITLSNQPKWFKILKYFLHCMLQLCS